MNQPSLEPHIRRTAEGLRAVGAGRDLGQVGDRITRRLTDLMAHVLDRVADELARADLAEVAIVYHILAERVAKQLKVPAADALRALAWLCDDSDAKTLLPGDRPPDAAFLDRLRAWLVWITVTYQDSQGVPAQRAVAIYHQSEHDHPEVTRISQEVDRADLPKHVREHLSRTGENAVRYQLYPAQSGRQ